ncbi:hypothetical protein J6590_106484 [Homalodisca vitripennis]|nr:hypothetical protein J6590_106484 [Homalodisca vitripennis]
MTQLLSEQSTKTKSPPFTAQGVSQTLLKKLIQTDIERASQTLSKNLNPIDIKIQTARGVNQTVQKLIQTDIERASQTLSKKMNVTVNLNTYSQLGLTSETPLQKSGSKHAHLF